MTVKKKLNNVEMKIINRNENELGEVKLGSGYKTSV